MSACRIVHLALDFGYHKYLLDKYTAHVDFDPSYPPPGRGDVVRRHTPL